MALKQMEPIMERVGDNKFYITPFAAFKAANLTGELASVLAPLLGVLAPLVNDGEDKGLMDIDAQQAAQAMSGCSAISGDKLETLMKKLLLGGHIAVEFTNEDGETEGLRLDMELVNELFCGDVQDMFVLCFHVIKLNFGGFFQEVRQPIWKSSVGECEDSERDALKYGKLDYSQFSELELRCYILIKAKIASMYELKQVYTLDEMLKLYALYQMELDIEKGKADELERRT